MGEWECTMCGFIHEGEQPPATCPDCGAPKQKFEYYSYEDEDEWDDEELFDDVDELDADFDDELSIDGDEGS